MDKNNTNSHVTALPLASRLLHLEIWQKIQEKKKEVFYALGACLLLFSGCFFWLHKSNTSHIENQLLASEYAKELQRSAQDSEDANKKETAKSDQALFTSLFALAKSDSKIRTLYNGLIGQCLMVRGQKNELVPYANKATETLSSSGLYNYASFSKIAQLTSDNKLKEAFEESHKLQLALEEQKASSSSLYAATLLQQAALLSALGFKERKEKTIEQLKEKMTHNTGDTAAFAMHLQDKDAHVLDFLKHQ